jgi:hypothetical protein
MTSVVVGVSCSVARVAFALWYYSMDQNDILCLGVLYRNQIRSELLRRLVG